MLQALDVAKYMRRNVDLGQSVIFTEPTKKIIESEKQIYILLLSSQCFKNGINKLVCS
jgi:hypothetical protein